MVVLSQPKNSLKKFRRIGIIAGKPNRETAIIIFLLQHLTDPMLNGKKSKINLFSKKESESSDFRKKFENPELITVNIPANKTGRNYNSIQEVFAAIPEKNEGIASVLLADMEQLTPPGPWDQIFGTTIGDALIAFKEKEKESKDIIAYQKNFTDLLFPRLVKICNMDEEFRKNANEKIIMRSEQGLTFATVKSEKRNNDVRLIAHLAAGVDIMLHRRETEGGNFISSSERAEKYMPAILEALRKEELTRNPNSTGLWNRNYKVIYSNHGFRTLIKFAEVIDIVEKTVMAFKPTNGTGMPVEAKHSDTLQTDSALADAPPVKEEALAVA